MTAASLGLLPGKAQAAEPMTGFVNGVAAVQGIAGADWHTDLWIHNGRKDEPVTVRLFYAPKGTPANENNFVPVVVQPGTTVTLPDVIGTAFATQGSGGLFYQIIPQELAEGIIVESNTYNRLGGGKQFGQQVPGRQWINPGLEWGDVGKEIGTSGIEQYLPGPIDKTRYRANLGFITNNQCNQVRVRIRNKSSNELVHEVLDVTPNTWYQWVDIVNKFGLHEQLNGLYIEFIPLNGQAFSSVSIIDNKTNDASNFDGITRLEVEYNTWLLAAAYLEGANNSRWRSDVLTINGNPFSSTGINFFAYPRGADNSDAPEWRGRDYYIGQTITFPNILSELFEYPLGTSATIMVNQLEQEPERDLLVFMRTYSEGQNAQGETETYGQAVRAVNWKDSLRNDLEGRIVGVVHNRNFRTNLILQNTTSSNQVRTDTAQDAVVEIYADNGELLGSKTYNLLPGEYRHINKVAEDILGEGATIENATIVVKAPNINPRWRGGVIAAASVVNGNTVAGTNDPRLIIAQPIDRSDPVQAFVDKWLPDFGNTRIYLNLQEAQCMLNPTFNLCGTQSYAQPLAAELVKSPANTNGTTVNELTQWLREQADGQLQNGELYHGWDPVYWDNDDFGEYKAFVLYGEPNGGLAPFPLLESEMRNTYNIIRDFLITHVRAHPEYYGGKPGGVPDPEFDPGWSS